MTQQIDSTEYTKFIALGNHAWGRGNTIKEAYQNCKNAGGGNTCTIYKVRESDYVDQCDGSIWHNKQFPPIIVEKRKKWQKTIIS